MKKISYSQILDAMAGDHTRGDLDLAPTIIARIQKGKGIRMKPAFKLVTAILLVAIAFVVLFYSVPGVAAAIGRWFGYVPEVGLVRVGEIRVLAEPASVTRDGVTLTVDQVILNQERTALVYSVEGIPGEALAKQPGAGTCDYKVSLRLPDGSLHLATPEGQLWATGYQHRFNYPALPADVNDAALVIPCLFHTRTGAVPENWEIPLRFMPAPPDMTAFPVIEIPTPTAPAATEPPVTAAAEGNPSAVEPVTEPLSLTLDRAVQMDDGYLLYATLHWEDTSFSFVDQTDLAGTLHLLDASGQEMLYEVVYDENTGAFGDKRQTVFAIKTAPVQEPGPLTLVLDSVVVDLPADASFVFEAEPRPEAGQQWTPNLEVKVGERRLHVQKITAWEDGFEFEMSSDTGILKAGVLDLEHAIGSGYCTESADRQGDVYVFGCGLNYLDGMPAGPITFSITSIGVQHVQPLQAQWTPPAVSTVQLPEQAVACLSAETWRAGLAQPAALPEGLTGKVLVSGPVDQNNPNGAREMAIVSLDGSQRQPLPGAEDGSFSPDGTRLAYSVFDQGIMLMDLASGETTSLPGTASGDFNPVWSPDGTQIVFNRGMGIFDLFIVNPDGSDMRQLTLGGVQEFPAGWLPDGDLLYSVPGREYEIATYRVDLQSAESQLYSNEHIQSVSPDGQHVAIGVVPFGERWQVVVGELDGDSRLALVDGPLWVLSPQWSSDGEWLLAGVSAADSGSVSGVLFNLRSCEVIPLPHLRGTFYSWVP